MIQLFHCQLVFAPTDQILSAKIISLTTDIVEEKIDALWWTNDDSEDEPNPPPIDRYWDWTDTQIETDGRMLESELVGVVTGDNYVQGAMLISREGVASFLNPGAEALFVERLFTAPVNRSSLRVDKKKHFAGVGPALLGWGVHFSIEMGHQGRLRLDGSPDYVAWYESLGFTILGIEPIVFEGVQYTRMELSAEKARELIDRLAPGTGKKGKK